MTVLYVLWYRMGRSTKGLVEADEKGTDPAAMIVVTSEGGERVKKKKRGGKERVKDTRYTIIWVR